MSIGSVLIGLQASGRPGGVTSEEFLAPLNIQPGEVEATRADDGAWASGMVYFAVVRYSEFDHVDKSADAGAQSEAFHAGVVEAFRTAARRPAGPATPRRSPPDRRARVAGATCRGRDRAASRESSPGVGSHATGAPSR